MWISTKEVSALQWRSGEDDVWAWIRTLLRFKLDGKNTLQIWSLRHRPADVCPSFLILFCLLPSYDHMKWLHSLKTDSLSFELLLRDSEDLIHVYPLSKQCTARWPTRTPLNGNTWISTTVSPIRAHPGKHQTGLKQQRWWMEKSPLPRAMRTTRWGFLLVQPISHFTSVAVNLNGPSKTFLRIEKRQGGSCQLNRSNLEKTIPQKCVPHTLPNQNNWKNPKACWNLVFHWVLDQVAANFGGGRSTLAIWG